MYRIIGIVDGHYVVKTPKGLKKVKIDVHNKKNINDVIKIQNRGQFFIVDINYRVSGFVQY